MLALIPLLYQGLVSSGLILLIYAVIRMVRPTDYSNVAVSLVVGVLGLLSIINPIMGLGIRPWGLWLLYTIASSIGGLLLITLAAILYDTLRPAGVAPSGPAALGFMIAAFPYLLTNLVVLVIRFFINR